MSYSSLWEINKNWSGKEYSEYKNSWLFSPIVWDILLCKYVKSYERDGVTNYMVWTLPFGRRENNFQILNERINNSTIQFDRVLWELTNQSVFNAKDKEFIADCIEKFVENNFADSEYKDRNHIKERFHEIAKDIRELPKRCKYFVFKNTSCDDNVEWWFNRKRLSSWEKIVCEFTIIANNKVLGFRDNLEMCCKELQEKDNETI